jgi:predicted metal-binding protein
LEIPICNTCNSSKPNSYVLVCTGCASKIKESQTTDTQQLKAEIAALANELHAHCKDRSYVLLDRFIERMRQLSAV